MVWKKGQSGNNRGRPRDTKTTKLISLAKEKLIELLSLTGPITDKQVKASLQVLNCYEKQIKTDMDATITSVPISLEQQQKLLDALKEDD